MTEKTTLNRYRVVVMAPAEYLVWATDEKEANRKATVNLMSTHAPVDNGLPDVERVTTINSNFARSLYKELKAIIRIISIERLY